MGGVNLSFRIGFIWPVLYLFMKAVIFDMDGVIADTQKVHAEIESKLLLSIGIKIPAHELTARFAGVSDLEMFDTILKENENLTDVEELLSEKRKKFHAEIEKGVNKIEGAVELIQELHLKGIPLAVASSSRREWIERILQSLGVYDTFEVVVSGYEVPHHKPAPDIFLKAAELLKVAPSDCIVIEDGLKGVFAAQKAEMKVIGLGPTVKKIADYSANNMKKVREILWKFLIFP